MGIGMSFLTEMAKKFNIHPKAFILGLSLGIGCGMAIFQELVPSPVRENIVLFVQSALGTAVVIYDFIIKPHQENQ